MINQNQYKKIRARSYKINQYQLRLTNINQDKPRMIKIYQPELTKLK